MTSQVVTWSTSGAGCVACPANLSCTRCNSANTCVTCLTLFFLNPYNAAGCCPTGFTWSGTAGTGCVFCQTTSLNCQRCDSTGRCGWCNSNTGLYPSYSVGCCPYYYTWSATTSTCVYCWNLNCNRCDIAGVCAECSTNNFFLPATATSIGCCPVQYTWSSGSCRWCPTSLNCDLCQFSS